jgi:hypothetical protein
VHVLSSVTAPTHVKLGAAAAAGEQQVVCLLLVFGCLQVPVDLPERQVRARLTALPIVEAVVQNRVVTLQGRLLQQQEPAAGDDVGISSADKRKGELASLSNDRVDGSSRTNGSGWHG